MTITLADYNDISDKNDHSNQNKHIITRVPTTIMTIVTKVLNVISNNYFYDDLSDLITVIKVNFFKVQKPQ